MTEIEVGSGRGSVSLAPADSNRSRTGDWGKIHVVKEAKRRGKTLVLAVGRHHALD